MGAPVKATTSSAPRERRPLLKPGDVFRGFHVVRMLGKGGIGEVYEVLHQGKPYALKVIQTQWLKDEAQIRRMTLEGELLVRIKHPYVVDVFETGVAEGSVVWIRMELLRGMTLREMLRRRGLLSIALVCSYVRHAALAAHQCHVLGVIHRDIKPENIFVALPEERAKLLDFGLAKLHGSPDTAEGNRHGTPLYMAPEQIRGHRVTPATDVYALGLVAYEALCGAHPFVEDEGDYDLYALYHRHFSEVPPELTQIGVPAPIAEVVARALEKDPRHRYSNGFTFAEALWGAWQLVDAEDPESCAPNPGEPSAAELVARAGEGLRFGTTGPSSRRKSAEPSAPLPLRTTAQMTARLARRASSLPGPPPAELLVAPSAPTAEGPQAASPASGTSTEPMPYTFRPVRTTEPLIAIRPFVPPTHSTTAPRATSAEEAAPESASSPAETAPESASSSEEAAPENAAAPRRRMLARPRRWVEILDAKGAGVGPLPHLEANAPLLEEEENPREAAASRLLREPPPRRTEPSVELPLYPLTPFHVPPPSPVCRPFPEWPSPLRDAPSFAALAPIAPIAPLTMPRAAPSPSAEQPARRAPILPLLASTERRQITLAAAAVLFMSLITGLAVVLRPATPVRVVTVASPAASSPSDDLALALPAAPPPGAASSSAEPTPAAAETLPPIASATTPPAPATSIDGAPMPSTSLAPPTRPAPSAAPRADRSGAVASTKPTRPRPPPKEVVPPWLLQSSQRDEIVDPWSRRKK